MTILSFKVFQDFIYKLSTPVQKTDNFKNRLFPDILGENMGFTQWFPTLSYHVWIFRHIKFEHQWLRIDTLLTLMLINVLSHKD